MTKTPAVYDFDASVFPIASTSDPDVALIAAYDSLLSVIKTTKENYRDNPPKSVADENERFGPVD
jgi:hypothetical protein